MCKCDGNYYYDGNYYQKTSRTPDALSDLNTPPIVFPRTNSRSTYGIYCDDDNAYSDMGYYGPSASRDCGDPYVDSPFVIDCGSTDDETTSTSEAETTSDSETASDAQTVPLYTKEQYEQLTENSKKILDEEQINNYEKLKTDNKIDEAKESDTVQDNVADVEKNYESGSLSYGALTGKSYKETVDIYSGMNSTEQAAFKEQLKEDTGKSYSQVKKDIANKEVTGSAIKGFVAGATAGGTTGAIGGAAVGAASFFGIGAIPGAIVGGIGGAIIGGLGGAAVAVSGRTNKQDQIDEDAKTEAKENAEEAEKAETAKKTEEEKKTEEKSDSTDHSVGKEYTEGGQTKYKAEDGSTHIKVKHDD